MASRARGNLLPALGLSLLINVSIIVLATVLANQKSERQDITNPVGIDLIDLASPEPPAEEKAAEAEKPAPKENLDVSPDLFRPEFAGGIEGFGDGGVAIDVGALAQTAVSENLVFESYELDQAPKAIVRVPPLYPYAAREKNIQGAVQVRMLVNPDGSVGQVQVLDARPPGIFEDAVKRTVPQWRFNPGKMEGRPVAAWVVTTIQFNLD